MHRITGGVVFFSPSWHHELWNWFAPAHSPTRGGMRGRLGPDPQTSTASLSHSCASVWQERSLSARTNSLGDDGRRGHGWMGTHRMHLITSAHITHQSFPRRKRFARRKSPWARVLWIVWSEVDWCAVFHGCKWGEFWHADVKKILLITSHFRVSPINYQNTIYASCLSACGGHIRATAGTGMNGSHKGAQLTAEQLKRLCTNRSAVDTWVLRGRPEASSRVEVGQLENDSKRRTNICWFRLELAPS